MNYLFPNPYLKEEEGLRFIESVMRYLISSTEISVKDTLKSVEQIDSKVKETLMTTAQKLVEQGSILDKREVLIKQLTRKFGLSDQEKILISSITDKDKLDIALDEIIFAESKRRLIELLQ